MKLSWAQRFQLGLHALKGNFDVRSGSLAESLLKGLWPSAVGEPPKRQGRQFLDAYNQMPWARAPVSRIASSVSMLHWRLYYKTGEDEMGRKRPVFDARFKRMAAPQRKSTIATMMACDEMREVTDHIFLNALCEGSAMLSGQATWKVSQAWVDMVGECFWMKERNAVGAPIAFWPIPPYWVIDTPSMARRTYRVSFRSWQGEIPDSEIVWFKDPDPVNPYGRGTGSAQTLSDEYESDEYAAKHVKQFFFNRAKPDFLAYPKGEMNNMGEDQVKAMERRWLDNQQGFWRAFRPQFMSREIGIHEFTQNFQHLQLNELRSHSRDTALQTYGIPPEILGVIENSNRSTIDGAFYAFQKLVIEPRAEFWRSELQQKLIADYDPRLIIDYDSPVQEDREFMLNAYKAKPATVTVDEWRQLQGLPPLGPPEGDMRFQPINETVEAGFEEAADETLEDQTPDVPMQPGQPSEDTSMEQGDEQDQEGGEADEEDAKVRMMAKTLRNMNSDQLKKVYRLMKG